MNEIRCREGVLNSANTYAPSCAVWYTRDMLVWQYSSELASVLTTYNVRVDSASERVEKLERVIVTQNRHKTVATQKQPLKSPKNVALRISADTALIWRKVAILISTQSHPSMKPRIAISVDVVITNETRQVSKLVSAARRLPFFIGLVFSNHPRVGI